MSSIHRFFRRKSLLVRLLLAIFVANIFAASAGFSASFDWLEHEKSHYLAVDEHMAPDSPASTPEKPAGKKQNKHECHASHFFETQVATVPMPFPQAEPCRLAISYLISALRETSEPPFRPPQ